MKDKMRIIITDSGLGGLGFSAELGKRLKTGAYFSEAELIFFNCCPSPGGYQTLETNEQRSEIFSRALSAIDVFFPSDLIIIACNSLSAIYKDTPFSKNARIPVTGIIEPGVRCAGELLSRDAELNILMFATPTTVSAGVHKQILAEAGFSPGRLLYQECRNLPRAIDYGNKAEIKDSIEYLMDSAVRQLAGKSFALALFCTHFAYVREYFEDAARPYANFSGEIVDPDSALLDLVLSPYESGRFDSCDLNIKVVSQARQSEQMKNSIIPFLQGPYPETVQALRDDIHLPGLFDCSL